MTTTPSHPLQGGSRRALRRPARRIGHAATLLPAGLLALAAMLTGRPETARRRWLRAGSPPPGAPAPSPVRTLGYGLLTTLLGALALVAYGLLGLMIARGWLYGLVTSGPHDGDWGGPTTAGAWLAHFAVSLPVGAIALALLHGVATLHLRLTAPLRGEPRPAWVLPLTLLLCAAGALFVVAWTRQLSS